VRAGRSLRILLARLIWLCVGPLAILAVFMAAERVRDVQANRDREATILATTLAASVDQDLSARIGALTMLARSPLGDDASRWGDLYRESQGFRESFGSHVILADLKMHMLFNTRAPFGATLPMLPQSKGRAAAPIAVATGRPAVGDLVQGPLAREALVAVAVPALRDGKTAFLLLTVFEARQFQRHLDQIALPAGWSIALLDGSGATIARRAPAGLQPAADIEANGRFVVRSAVAPWTVALEIPHGIYQAPLLEAVLALTLAILGATLTGVVGGMLVGRRIGSSVAALARTAATGTGPSGITEIDMVQQLLDQGAKRREAAEATLLLSEQRFRRLFYEAPLPQALVGKDGTIAGLNARFVQVFGYGMEDLPTVSDWWLCAYPDPAYRTTVVEDWNAAIAGGGSMTTIEAVERRVTCKSGAVRSMLVSGIGVGDEFLVAFFDVTERNEAEEALHQSSALYQHALDNMLEGCQIVGLDWRYRYINSAAARQHRQPRESLIGRTMPQAYPGIETTDIFATLRRCMDERIEQHSETEFVFPDGSRGWFEVNVQPVPQGIAIFSVDISERKRVDEVRERLAAIVESSDDAIVSSTVDGAITSWNQGAERMFGFGSEEAIGKPVREIIRCEDGEVVREHERRIFHPRRGARYAGAEEVVRLHRDGHSMTLSVVTGVIRDASGTISALSAIMRDITAVKRRDGELQALIAEQVARDRQMRDLTARLRTLREEECTRISREVHDGLGQLLTCLKMDIRWMTRRLAGGASAEDLSTKLAETEALVDQTVESVQRIAVELRPSALDTLGLPAAIRDEARRFEARSGVVAVVESCAASSPDQAVATTLFRILQELLTNIARHAQASRLSINLTTERDRWELRVRDNGIGIASAMVNRATSLGLLGMTERAEAVGGTFGVERHPDGGTLATVRIPHPPVSRLEHESRTDR